MDKFNFSLERVYDFRKQEEEAAKVAYGMAQKKVSDKEQEIESLYREKKQIQYRTDSVEQMRIAYHYASQLEQMILNAYNTLEALKDEAQAALETFIEEQKKRKVLEKLRSKKEEAYLLEKRQVEQKELDDFRVRITR